MHPGRVGRGQHVQPPTHHRSPGRDLGDATKASRRRRLHGCQPRPSPGLLVLRRLGSPAEPSYAASSSCFGNGGGDGGLDGIAGLRTTIEITTPSTTNSTAIPAIPAKPPRSTDDASMLSQMPSESRSGGKSAATSGSVSQLSSSRSDHPSSVVVRVGVVAYSVIVRVPRLRRDQWKASSESGIPSLSSSVSST